jgi:riboflavin synthase alpha subunit
MFTGIVEKTVHVVGVTKGPKFNRLTLAVDWGDVADGESVAVNGVCLTVAERWPGQLGFDVVQETLGRTNLGLLQAGDEVHVERSMRVGDRVSGHFVQGHVDGTARLLAQTSGGDEWRLRLDCPPPLAKYITPKGSVALDGVSLTVASVEGHQFEVALIPTTMRLTTLGRRDVGWPFNDILAKTVVATLERQRE